MWKVFLVMFIITVIISYLWVRGFDIMKKEHLNYKGDDFLKLEDEEKDFG
jgi:uncharacterized membrane-anchored protein